jgi:hypothetical protein
VKMHKVRQASPNLEPVCPTSRSYRQMRMHRGQPKGSRKPGVPIRVIFMC